MSAIGIGILEQLLEKIDRLETRVAELAEQRRPGAERLVTVQQYAKSRSISVSLVRKAVREGALPATKFGTAVRVPDDVEIGVPIVVERTEPTQVANRILRAVAGGRS